MRLEEASTELARRLEEVTVDRARQMLELVKRSRGSGG
jgi:hypothetical protein